jgi:DNA-directed RNA polymerase subunit beta
MARTLEGMPIRMRGTTNFYDTAVTNEVSTLGQGRPAFDSTLVNTASTRAYLKQFQFEDLPNLVEMQLESYAWFLNKGLRELFDSFSPIEISPGNMALEFSIIRSVNRSFRPTNVASAI